MELTAVSELHEPGVDDLLARVADDPVQTESLHRVLGPFCHQYRNVLNSLKMSLYLVKRAGVSTDSGAWISIEERYAAVEALIERVHQLCRPMPVSPVKLPIHLLFEERSATWRAWLAERGRALVLMPPEEQAVVAFDLGLLTSGLNDLVAWRVREGCPASDLNLAWSVSGGWFEVEWSETPASEGDAGAPPLVPGAGQSADAGATRPAIPGWVCVPLLTRIVALHGGSVERPDEGPDGWRMRLRWPVVASGSR